MSEEQSYKTKLKILMNALEIEEVEYFIDIAKPKDYERLGLAYINAVKLKIKEAK